MTVFISRKLKPESPLLRWAEARGNAVISRSFLSFEAVLFTAPTDADWWFFYSPRAVEFGLRGVSSKTCLAAIGPGTADCLIKAAGRVDFTGDGNPKRTAKAFGKVANGQRVFFPRASQSRLSIQTMLMDRVDVLDAVCYYNVPSPATAPENADVFVFTSPLNVAAYVDHQPLPEKARVIAIGPSTGNALLERGIDCAWPEDASEDGIIGLL